MGVFRVHRVVLPIVALLTLGTLVVRMEPPTSIKHAPVIGGSGGGGTGGSAQRPSSIPTGGVTAPSPPTPVKNTNHIKDGEISNTEANLAGRSKAPWHPFVDLGREPPFHAAAEAGASIFLDEQRTSPHPALFPTPDDQRHIAAHAAAERASAGAGNANRYLEWLASDEGRILPWKPGRAAPIICNGKEYFSGHFSIPPENIMTLAFFDQQIKGQKRAQDWGTVIPYRPHTYVFKTERDYRLDLEKSRFGYTRRKYGFATMRNLELLAAGTIPFFCNAHQIPPTGTLASLPLAFFRQVVRWPGVAAKCWPPKRAEGLPIDMGLFNVSQFNAIARKLLQWTQVYQRTDYHALYVLSATSLRTIPRTVLVLWASHYSILLTTIVHGLRLLGTDVIDIPRRGDTYRSDECEQNKHKTYAKGWFFFCKAPESKDISRDDIGERIKKREFDLIIISITDTLTYHMKDPRQEVPHYDEIVASYPRDKVLTINDADLIRPMTDDVAHAYMHNMSLYFKRETHGCSENIMYRKM